jgi:hypothetical protein
MTQEFLVENVQKFSLYITENTLNHLKGESLKVFLKKLRK